MSYMDSLLYILSLYLMGVRIDSQLQFQFQL